MANTTHGHHIEGTPHTTPIGGRARCGGVKLCGECYNESRAFFEKEQLEEPTFAQDLASVLNKHGWDTKTNVPDFLLAAYLKSVLASLAALNDANVIWHKGPKVEPIVRQHFE